MTPGLVSAWQLADCLPEDTLDEDIELGSHLHLAESSCGRFSILICEDLHHAAPDDILRAAAPSHVLAPVLDRELRARRWHEHAIDSILRHSGGYGVVSNSLVIQRAREAAKITVPQQEGPFSALAHLPEDARPNDYPAEAHRTLSSSAFEVAVFEFGAGM